MLFRSHPRDVAQHRRLADAGAAEQQDALPALDQVAQDAAGAGHGAPDAAGEARDVAAAIEEHAPVLYADLLRALQGLSGEAGGGDDE